MIRPSWTQGLASSRFLLPVAMAVVFVIILGWFARGALFLALAGALVGLALRTCADLVHRLTRLPTVIAVWAVVATTIAVTLGLVTLGGAAFAEQWAELVPGLHRGVASAVEYLGAVPAIASAVQSFDPSAVLASGTSLITGASGLVNSALGVAVALVVVVFVSIAGALEPQLYRDGFLALFARADRAFVASVLAELISTLRTWLEARLLSMIATGLLVWAGLSLLHIPLSGALAFLAGALAFIPNIGALIAGAPAVLMALAISPRLAIAVLGMYWIAHFIDDFLLSPFIERRIVRLPPILTLLAQIVLAMAGGILGIMLAAPIVATVIVLVRRLWVARLERLT